MGTNSYIEKLKARIDQLTCQVEHYKMLAQERNKFILITEVDPDSRTVEDFVVDAEYVRKLWKRIEELTK